MFNRVPHDDVIIWKHFPRCWSFVRGIHQSPLDSPHKGQWCGALVYFTLQWGHNERDGVSNCRRLDCLPNRLFRRWSKKASKLCVTGLCGGNPPVTGVFKLGPVTRKMFPFHDVIVGCRKIYTTIQMSEPGLFIKSFIHHGMTAYCA